MFLKTVSKTIFSPLSNLQLLHNLHSKFVLRHTSPWAMVSAGFGRVYSFQRYQCVWVAIEISSELNCPRKPQRSQLGIFWSSRWLVDPDILKMCAVSKGTPRESGLMPPAWGSNFESSKKAEYREAGEFLCKHCYKRTPRVLINILRSISLGHWMLAVQY